MLNPDLFGNDWFRRLEDYGDRWGLVHLSFDGVSIAEIVDADFDRLMETWEAVLYSLRITGDDCHTGTARTIQPARRR